MKEDQQPAIVAKNWSSYHAPPRANDWISDAYAPERFDAAP